MYPILFEIGPFVISSFGVMIVAAFLICNHLLIKDIKAEGYDSQIAEDITFRAAIGGIVGAKVYYLIENILTGRSADNISGLLDIVKGIFIFIGGILTLSLERIMESGIQIGNGIQNFGSGLVFLGGLIGGMIAVTIYVQRKGLKWLQVADWVAPFLALGHSIGRIGCFLVGDDYGIPSNLPWACAFPNGLPPINIPVHPTQIYEMSIYFLIFIYLRYRKHNQNFSGELMFEYLFLVGLFRFLVEFIRTNPKYLIGFSGAQYISIIMMVLSIYYIWNIRKTESIIIEEND